MANEISHIRKVSGGLNVRYVSSLERRLAGGKSPYFSQIYYAQTVCFTTQKISKQQDVLINLRSSEPPHPI